MKKERVTKRGREHRQTKGEKETRVRLLGVPNGRESNETLSVIDVAIEWGLDFS